MLGTAKTSGSFTGAQYIVKIFICQPFVKEFAKKEPGFCIVLEALFNHEEHEGHESNKKFERGSKPTRLFPSFRNPPSADIRNPGCSSVTDHQWIQRLDSRLRGNDEHAKRISKFPQRPVFLYIR